MSQDDTPDLATPQAGKITPEAVALRAQPRAVTRLNRRTLAMLTGGLSVAVLGATIWSSYGLKWGLLTLGIVWLLDYGLFRAPRPSPVRATVLPVPGEHHG